MKRIALFLLITSGAFAQAPTFSLSSTSVQEGQTITATCLTGCSGITWKVNGITGGNPTVGTITGNDTSATYTAPASIVANNVVGGCPMAPNDAIWNVPAIGVPLISNWRNDPFLNDTWYINYASGSVGQTLKFSGGPGLEDTFRIGLADSTSPLVTMYDNSGSVNIQHMPWPQAPSRGRENGLYDVNNTDQHSEVVNTTTCDLWDEYADDNTIDSTTCTAGSGEICYLASSASKQPANSYTRTGGVDAGGNMVLPYLVHLSEIHDGAINHVMHLNVPTDTADNQNNIMWPATYGTGFCSGNEIVGLTGFPTGTNYSAATTISFSGGGGAGTQWTPIISGGVITGATFSHANTTSWTSTPTVVITDPNGTGSGASLTAKIDRPCYPYGARFVLDQTWLTNHTGSGTSCPAGNKCTAAGTPGYVVLQGLANYGGLALDNQQNNLAWLINMADDISQDPAVRSSITAALGTLTITAFHIHDDNQLGKSTADGINRAGTGNAQVAPDNDAGYIPPGAAWISATNGSGTSFSKAVTLQAATIGTTDSQLYVLAGDYSGSKGTSGGYQIPYWVRGTASTAVTWTCPGCTGTITSGGIYTPPASEATIGLQDVAVCTLNSDSNVVMNVHITILPNAGNYSPNTIRVDVGTSSNITDGAGHSWLGNIGYRGGSPTPASHTWTYVSNSNPEKVVYNTSTWVYGDMTWKFIVPNGNYSVRTMTGWDNLANGPASISETAWNHMPYMIWSNDNGYTGWSGGDGGVKGLFWNPSEHSSVPYAQNSDADFKFGDHVVNNELVVGIGGANINGVTTINKGFSACPSCFPLPEVSGIDIEPDAASPHWVIGVTNGTSQNNPAHFLSDSPVAYLGGNIGLYVQDWYTGLSSQTTGLADPVWSIVSGPGTLTAITTRLTPGNDFPLEKYTAPSTAPNGDAQAIVKACSQSNPAICATLNVTIAGPNTGVNSSAVTVK